MSTTTKKTKKTALSGAKTSKKEEIYYDSETGKRISKAGYFFRKMQQKPMVQIVDMRAVLK